VLFVSNATNLVPTDTNGCWDVFVHDRLTGKTTRVSVDSSGVQANGDSHVFESRPAMTPDGRFVAFASHASNLVAGDTNGCVDVFLHDRQSGRTSRVSVDSAGREANGDSGWRGVSLSSDGRFVFFTSLASNLVADDHNDVSDVFVHDMVSGTTTRLSVPASGSESKDYSYWPCASADGGMVVFTASGDDLVPGDHNLMPDIVLCNRASGVLTLVSVASDGRQADDASDLATLSADGSRVEFTSAARNLDPDKPGSGTDLYVHDVAAGTTRWVSPKLDGKDGGGGCYEGTLSGDGRVVSFDEFPQLFLPQMIHCRDVDVEHSMLVTVSSDGEEGNNNSGGPVLSGDGRICAYASLATNLVAGDTNGFVDTFVHTRATTRLVGVPASPNPVYFTVWPGERANLAIVLLSASGFDGFVLGGRRIPLTLDATTLAGFSISTFLSAVVDGSGLAQTPTVTFPVTPPGQTFFTAAITIDAASGQLETVTAPIAIVTQ
jgi:hypothetical protein